MYICFYWKTYIQSVNYSWYQSNTNKQKTSISCWRAFEKLFIMTFIYISQYLTLQSMVAILASNETFSVDWITRCFIMTMATPIFTVVTIESFWTGWKTRIIFEKKLGTSIIIVFGIKFWMVFFFIYIKDTYVCYNEFLSSRDCILLDSVPLLNHMMHDPHTVHKSVYNHYHKVQMDIL